MDTVNEANQDNVRFVARDYRRPCPACHLSAAPYSVSMLPSTYMTASAPTISIFRGSITQPAHSLSTLRNMVYPNATQNSLPAGGQPLPDGTDYPQDPNTKFQQQSLRRFALVQAFPAHHISYFDAHICSFWLAPTGSSIFRRAKNVN